MYRVGDIDTNICNICTWERVVNKECNSRVRCKDIVTHVWVWVVQENYNDIT